MDGYILSVDQGTSATKVLIFDQGGRIVSQASRPLVRYSPREGWFEEDPNEIWQGAHLAIGDAIGNARILPEDIAGIGVANQQGSTVVWDRDTGEAIGRAILWLDRRTQPICERFSKAELDELLRRSAGEIVPNLSCTKLCWLLENDRAVQKALARGVLMAGTIDSWLIWKLTGGAAHITDPSNASVTGLLNKDTVEWDDVILGAFGVPPRILPSIRSSSEIYATTSPDGFFGARVPVCASIGDQTAAAFGQACLYDGMTKITIGTGAFMIRSTAATRLPSKGGIGSPILWEIGGREAYGLEGFSDLSGEVLSWLRSNLGLMDSVSDADGLAIQVPDSGGVYFVPAMIGMHAPILRPKARGAIIGLKLETTKHHIIRAALESLAYQARDSIEAMERVYGFKTESLRVDGGCAKSDFLMQFMADILGIPVDRPAVTEASALGAAYLAGLAVGYWRSAEEATSNWRLDTRFEPRIAKGKRNGLYAGWLEAIDLSGRWQESKKRPTPSSIASPAASASRLEALSPREAEVMRLLILGVSMRDIAARLNTSIKTVEKQRRDAIARLGVDNLVSAVRVCVELGLAQPHARPAYRRGASLRSIAPMEYMPDGDAVEK
jgi:glycerol kinase